MLTALVLAAFVLQPGAAVGDEPHGGGTPTDPGGYDVPDLPDFPFGSIVPSEAVGYLQGQAGVSPSGGAQYSICLLYTSPSPRD